MRASPPQFRTSCIGATARSATELHTARIKSQAKSCHPRASSVGQIHVRVGRLSQTSHAPCRCHAYLCTRHNWGCNYAARNGLSGPENPNCKTFMPGRSNAWSNSITSGVIRPRSSAMIGRPVPCVMRPSPKCLSIARNKSCTGTRHPAAKFCSCYPPRGSHNNPRSRGNGQGAGYPRNLKEARTRDSHHL